MLYIHIAKNSIEVISSKKTPFSEGRISSSARKSLDYDLLDNGFIKDEERLIGEILSLFDLGYPDKIKNDAVSLVIPDDQVTHARFQIKKENSDALGQIIDQAKQILPKDITAYENFYKEVETDNDTVDIVYSAVPLEILAQYKEAFARLKLDIEYLTTESFAIYSLCYPHFVEKEPILFCDYRARSSSYLHLDPFGPRSRELKKSYVKSIKTELKGIIKKTDENKKINKVLIAGEKSLEIDLKDEEIEGLNIVKFADIIDRILGQTKLEFDSGGVPKLYYDKVLGLMYHQKNPSLPNFASDIDKISIKELPKVMQEEEKKEKAELESEAEQSEANQEQPKSSERIEKMVTEQIVEYKKSKISKILNPKIIVIGVVGVIVVGLLVFTFGTGNKETLLSFIGRISPTPTVTPVPTVTPTPTLDPDLKRTDIQIAVQNGTDKAGFAGDTSDKLEEMGYEDVAASNADNDEYEKTIIKIKEDKKGYLPLILADTKDIFADPQTDTLENDAKTDVVIILGAN